MNSRVVAGDGQRRRPWAAPAGSRRASRLTPSVTLIVFSPDARRMSSCTAGSPLPARRALVGRSSRVFGVADVGDPDRRAVHGRDDDVVESVGGVDAAERAQQQLRLCPARSCRRESRRSPLNRVAHLIDRQARRRSASRCRRRCGFRAARPPLRSTWPTPSTDLERALHLLVGDLGERAQAHGVGRQDDAS